MIKLIAADLDGTLLRCDKTISPRTKSVLESCKRDGIKFIYATGRGGSAERCVPSEMIDGRVNMNGATAYAGGELVYNRLISMDSARCLLVKCSDYGLKTAAEISGMHYSNFNVTAEWSGIKNYQIIDFKTHTLDAEKLYMVIRSSSDAEFIRRHIPDGLYLTVSRDNLAQVMHTEATKMRAITALAGYWGISAEEIVSFGDDLNDLDMLSGCGIGVAMGNALDEVKAVSDEVCDTNDNDGAARWLEENVL